MIHQIKKQMSRSERAIFTMTLTLFLAALLSAGPAYSQAASKYRIEATIGGPVSSSISQFAITFGKRVSEDWTLLAGVDLDLSIRERERIGDRVFRVTNRVRYETRDYLTTNGEYGAHITFRRDLADHQRICLYGGISPYFGLSTYLYTVDYEYRTDYDNSIFRTSRSNADTDRYILSAGVRLELDATYRLTKAVELTARFTVSSYYRWNVQNSISDYIDYDTDGSTDSESHYEYDYNYSSFNLSTGGVWLGLAYTF